MPLVSIDHEIFDGNVCVNIMDSWSQLVCRLTFIIFLFLPYFHFRFFSLRGSWYPEESSKRPNGETGKNKESALLHMVWAVKDSRGIENYCGQVSVQNVARKWFLNYSHLFNSSVIYVSIPSTWFYYLFIIIIISVLSFNHLLAQVLITIIATSFSTV